MTGLMYAYYTSIGFYPTFLQNYVEVEKFQSFYVNDCRLQLHLCLDKFLQDILVKKLVGRKTIGNFCNSGNHC